jgi:stage II sporulation protein M
VQEVKRLIKESKNYVLVATLLFIFGSWMGYVFSEQFETVINRMLEQLRDIIERLDEKQSPYYTAWFIFQNNTKASFMMIGLGLVFFLLPMFSLFANGLAIGYILKVATVHGVSPVDMVFYGILPHGILELPAILVAGGIGIFLGVRILQWLFWPGQFFSHLLQTDRSEGEDVRTFWEERSKPVLYQRIKGVAFLALLLVITLFFAAIVESFITPVLIEKYVDLNL